jgi:hypothetical protein
MTLLKVIAFGAVVCVNIVPSTCKALSQRLPFEHALMAVLNVTVVGRKSLWRTADSHVSANSQWHDFSQALMSEL